MRKSILCGALSLHFLLYGCVTSKPTYYWEGYSESLTNYKKEPTEEKRKAHEDMLVRIIKRSEENGARVPPGIYCELGYMMATDGKMAEAQSYFELEKKTYPESSILVDKLEAKLKKQ